MKNYLFKIVLSVTMLFAVNTFSQTLSGTITSDSQPMPGVNILIKGTSQGTQTDFDGHYNLENVSSSAVIVYSYLGFKFQEITIKGRDKIDVIMIEDASTLDEVVIIGLGQTQNKRTVSTAIAKVSSEEIKELSITRPEAALQGTMPGVVVAQNSGAPGAPLAVRIRGVSTPNGADPLYLVDGFQVPNLQHLNSGDITSINILKDAAAVAVYGARGGSGVVLVETKKGVRNMDHFKASIEGYYGFQNIRRESDLMNKDEYLLYYKSALQYANTFGERYRPVVFNTIGDVTASQDLLPNTDWQDLIFASDVPIQNLHANVSDGGETYAWGVSAGLFEQGGVVGGPDKSNFERKNVHLNFDFDILKNLTVSANADFVGMDKKRVLENENNETSGIGIVTAANAVAPIYQAYDDNGIPINPSFGTGGPNANNQVYSNGVLLNSMNIYTSPLFMLMAADQLQTTDVKQYGGNIKWDPIDNLRVVGSYSRFSSKATFKAFQPDFSGTPITDEQYYFVLVGNQLNQNEWTRDIDNIDANAEYTFKNLGKNHLRGLVGTSFQHDKGTALYRQGNNLTENTFGQASLDQASVVTVLNPADQTNGFITPNNESKLFSVYARAIYDYDEKYLFTASLRADKSSKFGPNNQTGYFPAVSAGWVISQESFLKDAQAINLLKLRASWGINGVDNIREDEYNTVYNDDFEISRLGNPDIKWEEIEQTNIGLDINAFNNKLGLTLDYYIKNTNDILLELPPQLSSGAPGETFQNAGGVKNEGFEALLSFRSVAKEEGGFSWSASANVGFNNNTFEADPTIPPGSLTGGNLRQFGTPVTNTLDGYGISSFYGYKVDYINNRGELIFKDLDGDGVVNTISSNGASITDLDDRTIIGNPYPDVTYGFMISTSYKGFDLNANLYGATGNDIFDARYNSSVPYSNRSRDYLTYGLRPVLSGLAGSQGEVSDFYVKDGAFAKLKNLTIGYSFDKAAAQIGLERMRFFIQGQNLWTISNYKGGDPEIGPASDNPNSALDVGIDRGFYPQPTTFMLGFQFEY